MTLQISAARLMRVSVFDDSDFAKVLGEILSQAYL
jgi:hypothetical protein